MKTASKSDRDGNDLAPRRLHVALHPPAFRGLAVLGTLHVERVYMLVTIAYWALFAEKSWTSCRNNVPAFLLRPEAIFWPPDQSVHVFKALRLVQALGVSTSWSSPPYARQ